jgi:hypothetical protein
LAAAGGGFVGERLLEAIGQTPRPLDGSAVVADIGDLHLGRDALHLVLGQAELHQVAIGQQRQRMAGRADVLVDLEAALGGGAIVGAERPREVPVLVLQRDVGLGGDRHRAEADCGESDRARDDDPAHGPIPPSS